MKKNKTMVVSFPSLLVAFDKACREHGIGLQDDYTYGNTTAFHMLSYFVANRPEKDEYSLDQVLGALVYARGEHADCPGLDALHEYVETEAYEQEEKKLIQTVGVLKS